jgi:hypothetical protein
MKSGHSDDRIAAQRRRKLISRCDPCSEGDQEVVWRNCGPLTICGPSIANAGHREDAPARGHPAIERVKVELEGRYDAEVWTGTAQRPEQVGVLVVAGADQPAIRRDNLSGAQVVDGEAVLALQPPHAAAQGQPADAGMGHNANRTDESVLLRSAIELTEETAAVHASRASGRVNAYAAKR